MHANKEITIKVGFGDSFKDLTVTIPDGDVPPYQPGETLALVGQNRPRVDARAKVTGRARYTYDQRPTGLLHGKILRCPHPNADIVSIDISSAQSMPGVVAVIPFTEMFGKKTVRFAWDGVAAVAAETETQAEAALRAIKVTYQPMKFCVTREDSMRDGAPQVGRGKQTNVERISPGIPMTRDGNIDEERAPAVEKEIKDREAAADAIFKESAKVVRGTFETQVHTHTPLETHGVVCAWEGEKLVCHCSTQATFGVRGELMNPRGQVKAPDAQVICEYVGGGFGAKFGAGQEGVAGALLAKAAGRPVKLMLDRREEHTSAGNRPDSHQELTLGVKADGAISGLRARNWGTPGTGTRGAGAHNDVIYELGHIDKIEYGVRTNCGDQRALRAPGFPQGVFALEGIIDMAAEAVGLDPIEFRKRNNKHVVRAAEFDLIRKLSGWDEKYNRKPGGGTGPVKRGVGVASCLWFSAGGGGASVLVRIHKNGKVEVRNGAQDIGTGTRTVMGMVVAEELGLELAQVTTFIGNTADPEGPGSGGSTTIGSLTPAARIAGVRAREQLLKIVAEELQLDAAALHLKGGQVVRRDGAPLAKPLTFAQACGLLREDQISVLEARPVVARREPNYEGLEDTNAGVQVAEVAVDVESGEIHVPRFYAVQDAGKLLNPRLAEHQVRGGIIQGVSYALFERRIMDRNEGRMVNADFEYYKILGSVDCPELHVHMLDVFNGKNNTGVMGLGEPPIVATAAAVANAIYNAIGVRMTSLPITPKKVLAALAAPKEAKL
ncbi:MAG: xanthine dehydrogenase family protein molybdopterin-binding subunit [Planctomycetota bacterium]